MGKCLSKQSKKAKEGEDPDRTPYTPASPRNKQSEPIPIASFDSAKKPEVEEPESPWVKADGSPEKECDPVVKRSKTPPRNASPSKSPPRDLSSSKSPTRDASPPKKPVKIQDVQVKVDKPVATDNKAVAEKLAKEDKKPEEKTSPDVRSFSSSRTTSVVSTTSSDGQSKPVIQTTITEKTVTDSPLLLRDSKTYTGSPRSDTSLFSKTAPTTIDKNDLGVMSVKEIRSQRTSKTETKKEAEVSTKPESSSEDQPMALLGALKFLKPTSDGSDPVKNLDISTSSASSFMSSRQTTVTKTTDVNGEVTSQTTVKTESSSTSPAVETTIVKTPSPASPVVSSPTKEETFKIQSSFKPASSPTVSSSSVVSTSVVSTSPQVASSFEVSPKDISPVKETVEVVAKPKEEPVLVNGRDTVVTNNNTTVNHASESDSDASPSKISSIPVRPVSKIRPPSTKSSSSSETSPTKPVNGSLTESFEKPGSVSVVEAPVQEVPEVQEVQEVQEEVFEEEPKDSAPKKDIKLDYQRLFVDFTPYNQAIMAKHDFLSGTRNKQLLQVDEWLKSGTDERVMVVIGAGGVGKTSLASQISSQHQSRLAGSHFFCYNSPNVFHNRLRDVLISLAHQFCDVFPNYVSLLPTVGKLRDLIKKHDLTELYNVLLFYPFTNDALERKSDENMLIIIDALDECDPQDVGVLTDVTNNLNESCPEWLSVLVTCRADGKIADQLHDVGKVELKRKDPENMSDIKKYLKEPLGVYMDRISLDGGLTTLTKKTQGSFTCAQIYKNRLSNLASNTKIAMREVGALFPDGLEQNLQEIFKAYKERIPLDRELKNAYVTVTSVIACAREPLSLDFIFDIVGAKYFELFKEAVKDELAPVLNFEGERIEFINHCIVDWLFDTKAGEFRVDREIGRQEFSSLCTKWITGIIDGDLELDPALKAYALKHSVYHLTDIRGNTEPVGKILCSLKYAREKLCLLDINLDHLLDDYEHQHLIIGSDKVVTVKDYMRKYPQIWEQIRLFEKFIYDKKDEISACPKFVLHIAANYSRLERIQQNAKAELEKEPWLEDLTALPETHCVMKNLRGTVRALDISADGKTVAAVVRDEDHNVKLHILNGQTGEDRLKSFDIKSLNDRLGLLAKFMPDGNNIFVGSLTTLVSKQGKQVPSGLDATTVDLKEKYSIECCDVSPRYLGVGLTTFPWGGRSLHLSVFDMKTKKCLKTIEILRFRFGGSAQFCIKSVGMAKERPLVCACVKQSTKPQLRVIVWNITKFQVINSIDINNEDITKTIFISDHTLLLGAGLKSSSAKSALPSVSEFWNFKEVTNKSSYPWDSSEHHSLFASSDDVTISCRWYAANGNAVLEQWRGDDVKSKPVARYNIRGLSNVSEMQIAGDVLLFVSGEELYLFSVADLEPLDMVDSSRIPNISELMVDSLVFLPKSDTAIISSKRDESYTVYLCDLSKPEPALVATPFERITPADCKSIDGPSTSRVFTGPTACTERCFSSADGNYLFFNGGDHVKVLDQSHGNTKNIPSLKDLNESPVYNEYNAVKATASMKDNFIAVVYGQIPNKVFLYDVRSCNLLRKISLNVKDDKVGVVTDFTFMPAMGYLLTYHQGNNTFAAWNSRTGDQLSQESMLVAYSKASPALDRFVVSIKKGRMEGTLILRNADNKFCKNLAVGEQTWLADNINSDVEFSSDGTILVGVCQKNSICRVWNAANGELLQDLPSLFNGPTDVVGMLTNTHVLFHDDRLQAMDVASGDLKAVLPLEHQVERRFTSHGLRISSKGAVVSGATSGGILCIFSCHNFTTVKRKTTLQRMKSFRK